MSKKPEVKNISYVGNTSNPKLVFVLPFPQLTDFNFKKTEVPFGGNNSEYRLLRGVLSELKLKQSDVLVLFAVDYTLSKNQRKKVVDIAKTQKDRLCQQIYSLLSNDIPIILVGKIPNQVVLNIKQISNISGTLKPRNIADEDGKNPKKFTFIPLISPSSIQVNPLKYKKIFLKSVSFLKKYLSDDLEGEKIKYKIVKPQDVSDFIDNLIANKDKIPFLYLDTETSSLIYHKSKVLGVSLTFDLTEYNYYIPIYDYLWEDENGNIIEITENQREIIKESIRKLVKTFSIVGHNIKFDIVQMMMNEMTGIKEFRLENDTQLMVHLKYSKTLGSLKLKDVSRILFDVFEDWDEPIKEIRRQYAKEHKIKIENVSYEIVPTHILGKYACFDVHYTKLLYKKIIKELSEKEIKHLKNIIKVEEAVAYWEYFGCKLDKDKFEELKSYLVQEVEVLKQKLKNLEVIKDLFGNKFNPNSNDQLSVVAGKKGYNLPVIKKTKAGNISLNKEILEKYLELNDVTSEARKFVELLVEYKKLNKLYSSYIKPMPFKTDGNGVLRTDFMVCGTVTGRISSGWHTIPSRSELGKKFKKLITTRWDDGLIVSADFCLAPDILVYTDNGWKELINVKPGKDKVLNDLGELQDVYCIVDRGVGDVYEVETNKGFKIKSTLNHKYMCIDNDGNHRLASLKEIIDNDFFVVLKFVNVNLDKIKYLTYLGKQQVYDLSVSGNHLFIAQGFVVSNSQIEPRTLASLSEDEQLIKVYKDGKDIYKYLASVVFEIDYNKVKKHQRNAMKSLVLGILYGLTPRSLAQKINTAVEEAQIIYDNFFKKFSGVNNFIHNYLYKIGFEKQGITNMFGRFIPIPTYDKEKPKRLFRNYIIQSTASEMALFQFGKITHYLINNSFFSRVVGSVHDSIIIDTKVSELFKVLQLLKYFGEQEVKKYKFLKVPLVLDISIGESWGNSLELKSWQGNKMILEGSEKCVDFLRKRFDNCEIVRYKRDNEWLMEIKN